MNIELLFKKNYRKIFIYYFVIFSIFASFLSAGYFIDASPDLRVKRYAVVFGSVILICCFSVFFLKIVRKCNSYLLVFNSFLIVNKEKISSVNEIKTINIKMRNSDLQITSIIIDSDKKQIFELSNIYTSNICNDDLKKFKTFCKTNQISLLIED